LVVLVWFSGLVVLVVLVRLGGVIFSLPRLSRQTC